MEKRQEVIEAAIRLFSEKGIGATTVDEIAKEAGIAKGSFYKKFESKDKLLNQILEQFLDLMQEINDYVDRIPDLTAKEKIEKHCRLSLEQVFEERHFFLSILSAHDLCTANLVHLNSYLAEFEHRTMNMTKRMLLSAYGQEIDPFVWDIVIVFHSLFKEYAFQIANTRQEVIQVVSRFISDLLDMIIRYFLETRIEPIITPEMRSRMERIPTNPADKENQIIELFKMLERKAASLDIDNQTEKEITEAIGYLKEEFNGGQARTVMLKSLLSYLGQQKELSELCDRLGYLLFNTTG